MKRLKIRPGLHGFRLDPKQNNPREVAFFKQWQRENDNLGRDLLSMLLSRETDNCHSRVWLELGAPTERDRIVAATLIQWLGSNVGLAFVCEALKTCGYDLVAKDDK